jgi:hypothetical protein
MKPRMDDARTGHEFGAAVEVDRRTTDHDPPVDGEIIEERIEDAAADRVDRDVQRIPEFGIEHLRDRFGGVVDDPVGAQAAHERGLARPAADGDHPAAAQLGQLDQQVAQTTGRGRHGDGLAGLRLADMIEGQPGRNPGRGERQPGWVGVRDGHELTRRRDIGLAIAAAEPDRGDRVARRQARHLGADRLDRADRLDTGVAGQLEPDVIDRVAGDLGIEDAVDPAPRIADGDLTRTRRARRQVDEFGRRPEARRKPRQPDRPIGHGAGRRGVARPSEPGLKIPAGSTVPLTACSRVRLAASRLAI